MAIEQAPLAPPDKSTTRTTAPPLHRRDMQLGYLIHDVSRIRRKAFDQLMKPLGVTRAQWWVLAHLSRRNGMTQTELADLLDVGKASLGTLLDRLETGNWIERVLDPSDRRIKRLNLTERSLDLLERMTSAEREFNDQILKGMPNSDRDRLVALLTRVTKALNAEPADICPASELDD